MKPIRQPKEAGGLTSNYSVSKGTGLANGLQKVYEALLVAKKRPLLLIRDEVQTLDIAFVNPEKCDALTQTLRWIHNGETSYPVVLLCGGLGTSSEIFGYLGISRFRDKCKVNLGRLPEVDERAVIRDWLVQDGGAQEEGIIPWIQTIARETHGCPQHIMVYAQPAAKLLEAQNGKITPESLDTVLEIGRQKNIFIIVIGPISCQNKN